MTMERTDLGPAERIISTLMNFTDHIVHNRPGMVSPGGALGVTWQPVALRKTNDVTTVWTPKPARQLGVLDADHNVRSGNQIIGRYRTPGLFPEATAYVYQQIANVWRLDNEFAARWASWAWAQDHRDLKVLLAAFMLVQSRFGDAVVENGEVLFFDDDFRAVGEAMCLIRSPNALDAKRLLRIGDVLRLPEIQRINRELGFGRSDRNAALGRYNALVSKWLRYREHNVAMLDGLIKSGQRRIVQKLCRRVGYKPESDVFFAKLRWRQKQATEGHRTIAIGMEIRAADTWAGLTETQICELICEQRLNYKRVVGMLPQDIGLTPAIMAATIEAGGLSDADLVILTPTLEDLGLLRDGPIKDRWNAALQRAVDQRAANVARNVKSKETRERLQDAADVATAKSIAEVTRNLRVYCAVDKSGSMANALARAQAYLTRFLGGFPLDRLHVSVFNTFAQEIEIKAPKAAAVAHAFHGHTAGGGTSYTAGIRVLMRHRPADDEDVLIMFVGDEEDYNAIELANTVKPLRPMAFAILPVERKGSIVRDAARQLGIPCFEVNEQMFATDDPYAVTRIIRDLIAATPVTPMNRAPTRVSLVEQILKTDLLQRPAWAA